MERFRQRQTHSKHKERVRGNYDITRSKVEKIRDSKEAETLGDIKRVRTE